MEASSFFVHLLLVVSLVMPRGSPVADDLFSQIYRRGVVRQRSLRSIRARFTETTVSSLLVKPIIAHGGAIAIDSRI